MTMLFLLFTEGVANYRNRCIPIDSSQYIPASVKSNLLVCIENTTNRGGGSCYNFAEIQKIKEVCLKNNLMFHLDGARLFNALVTKQEKPKQYDEILI